MVTWFSGQLKNKNFIHLTLQAKTNISWQMKVRKHIWFNPGQWLRSIIQASHISLVPEPLGWAWGSDVPPTVSKEQVWDHLMKPNRQKSPGPDEMHPKVLGERVDVVAMPCSSIFEKSRQSGEVPGDWTKGNYSCFQEGKEENCHWTFLCAWEDHRADPLEATLGHIRDKEVIQDSQHTFTEANHAWAILWPSMMKWWQQSTREGQSL